MPRGSLELVFLTQTWPRYAEDTAGPFIRDLARALVAAGDRVTVLAPHTTGLEPRWQEYGIEVRTFRYAPERYETLGYGRSLAADVSVRPLAGMVAPLYGLAGACALRALLTERQQEKRPVDLVHAHWVVPNGPVAVAALLGRRAAERPTLAVGLHGSDVFLAERVGVRSVVARTLGRCALMTGCSPELVERVAALAQETGDRIDRVIPYGVDIETFSPSSPGTPPHCNWRRQLGIDDQAPVLLTVGRMAAKKGFDVLAGALPEILAQSPQAHVVLAGGGDLLEELRRATAKDADRVHFPGMVERDVLPDLYRGSNVFVLPAVHDQAGNVDGLPNVILEAMASGLPVVASGISGIPLAIEDGVNGRLVPERDQRALVEAIVPLLNDRQRSREQGANGRARAVSELTWTHIAGRYRRAYVEALAERGVETR